MQIDIRIDSHFSESPQYYAEGCYEKENDRKIFTWIQPAGQDEAFGAKYRLEYDEKTCVLDLERTGEFVSRMQFCEGQMTDGKILTQHGSFDLKIYTREMAFPEGYCGQAILRYDLHFQGQEPLENEMRIYLSHAKEEEN